MAHVYIVGLGPGSEKYILPEAVRTLENSHIIIGFKRAINSINFINVNKKIATSLNEILDTIKQNPDKNISVAASGDPCFYGITNFIKDNLTNSPVVIPGLSSFQYLMSKLSMPWQGAFLGSMHGREEEFINNVKNNQISIWLTDKKNTPDKLCVDLVNNKIKAKVYVGENLSYEDEKITIGQADKIMKKTFSNLAVVVIESGK